MWTGVGEEPAQRDIASDDHQVAPEQLVDVDGVAHAEGGTDSLVLAGSQMKPGGDPGIAELLVEDFPGIGELATVRMPTSTGEPLASSIAIAPALVSEP